MQNSQVGAELRAAVADRAAARVLLQGDWVAEHSFGGLGLRTASRAVSEALDRCSLSSGGVAADEASPSPGKGLDLPGRPLAAAGVLMFHGKQGSASLTVPPI